MKFNIYQTLRCLLYLMLFIMSHTSGVSSNDQKSVTRSFSKNIVVPIDSKEFNSYSALSHGVNETMNDAFHYVSCKRLVSQFLSCNITVETWPFLHGTFRSYCTNYKINVPDDNNDIINIVSTYQNSVIDSRVFLELIVIKHDADKINVKAYQHFVDMSNCSEIATFTRNSPPVNDDPVKFRVFYQDVIETGYDNEKYCDGKPPCKVIHNYKGNKIGEVQPVVNMKYLLNEDRKTVAPVSIKNPQEGYYIFEYNKDYSLFTISHVDSSGQNKKQISAENFPVNPRFLPHIVTSIYGNYAYCSRDEEDDKTIQCSQFDTQKVRINIKMKLPNTVDWLAVRDLSDGGFILVAGYSFLQDNSSRDEFRIQRFSADGQMYKALDIDELNFTVQDKIIKYIPAITENDNNEFCIFWIGMSTKDQTDNKNKYYKYIKWCVPTKYTIFPNQNSV